VDPGRRDRDGDPSEGTAQQCLSLKIHRQDALFTLVDAEQLAACIFEVCDVLLGGLLGSGSLGRVEFGAINSRNDQHFLTSFVLLLLIPLQIGTRSGRERCNFAQKYLYASFGRHCASGSAGVIRQSRRSTESGVGGRQGSADHCDFFRGLVFAVDGQDAVSAFVEAEQLAKEVVGSGGAWLESKGLLRFVVAKVFEFGEVDGGEDQHSSPR